MKELNKDKIKVTRPVYLYLVKNKIYKQFVNNCKEYQLNCNKTSTLYSLKTREHKTKTTKHPHVAILKGFDWCFTKEGSTFWYKEYVKAEKYERIKR